MFQDSIYMKLTNDDYSAKLGSEEDSREIINYLNENNVSAGFQESGDDYVYYMNPMVKSNIYQEIYVRYRLCNYKEEFILLEKNNKVEGLLGIKIPEIEGIMAVEINLMIVNRNFEYISEFINCAIDMISNYSLIKPTKIRICLQENNANDMVELLQRMNFEFEYLGKDELGWDKSTIVYSRMIS